MTVDMRRRERWLVRALLSLLVFFCCAVSARAAGEYRTVEVESLKITIDSEWAQRTAPGYLPIRFDITNLGSARVIDIVGRGMRYFMASGRGGGAQGGLELQQTIRLARGDRVRFTLPVPILADHENLGFEIQEDGRTIERLHFTGFQSRSAAADASALIVADPSSAFGTAAASWRRTMTPGAGPTLMMAPGGFTASGVVVSGRSSGGAVHVGPPLDFLLEPARLPTNWLGYTSVRAVVIGTVEWGQLTEPQKSALLTWTACGGDLIVADGDLNSLVPGARSALPLDAKARAYFFGRIHVPTSDSLSAAGGLTGALAATEKTGDVNWSLPANRAADWGTIGARGFRLPIPGVAGVPARTYLLILLAFSFVIGPVNYWFLLRKRRQVLLVLTAPLISAVFILLLAGYVVAGEGFGVRGRAMTFTMLDQVRMQAVTRASISLYASGMAPGGGLRFPRDVAVFPIGTDGKGSRVQHTMVLSELQRYASGVIQARSPTNLEEIAFRPARERLSFNVEGNAIRVVNGLDSNISTLVYRTGNTTFSLTTPLPAGGKGVLQPDSRPAGVAVPTGLPLSDRFKHLFANQPEGSYLAILDRSPFWDRGVSHVEERSSFHLVIGWPGGQP
jgi:hypothetical protein